MSKLEFIIALQTAISAARAFANAVHDIPEDAECEVIETRYLDPGETVNQKGVELCE